MGSGLARINRVLRNVYSVETGPEGCGEYVQTYVVLGSNGGAAVIDPGPRGSLNTLLEGLESLGVLKSVGLVVLTHIHLDHAGSATALARKLGARILVHPLGVRHLRDPERLWTASREVLGEVAEIYGKPDPGESLLIEELPDRSVFKLDEISFTTIHTPGHASHHLSLYSEDLGILFVGDAAGIYIVERDLLHPTCPPPFRYEDYVRSLDKLISSSPEAVAFPHMGVRIGAGILEKARSQIELWKELISRGEESLEEILRIEADLKSYVNDLKGVCGKIERKNLELTIAGVRDEIQRIRSVEKS